MEEEGLGFRVTQESALESKLLPADCSELPEALLENMAAGGSRKFAQVLEGEWGSGSLPLPASQEQPPIMVCTHPYNGDHQTYRFHNLPHEI